VSAHLGEPLSHLAAQADRATGDEGYPVSQVEELPSAFRLLLRF